MHSRVASQIVDPWIAGVAATLVGAAYSWRPSFWFDEAATIAGADRSAIDILRLVGNFDAVHGLYYLAMHVWFRFVPTNEFTARLPSAIAVGLGAAGMMVLARLIADRQTACAAAAAFAILPCTLWSAVEARSYALTAALAVWLTLVFVVAAKRQSARMWALYALLLAVAVATFAYLSTLVAAHAVTLLAVRQPRRALFYLISAASAGLIIASPIIVLGVRQKTVQLSWISEMHTSYPHAVLLDQWFVGSWMSAVACAIAVVGGTGILLTTKRNAGWPLAVAVPWFVVPTACLLVYSATYENIYLARHLIFTAPGVALLVGICVTAVAAHRIRLTVIVLVILALASASAFVTQRQTDSKPGDGDYAAIADVIAGQAKPNDCVGFDTKPYEPLRAVAIAYPYPFAHMNDITAGTQAAYRAQLLTQDLPPDSLEVAGRLRSCSRLWAVVGRDSTSNMLESATKQQLVIDRRWVFKNDEVVLMERYDGTTRH